MMLSKENDEQILLDVIMLSSKILNIFFSFLSEQRKGLYCSKIEDIGMKKNISISLIHMLCNRIFGIQSEQEKKLFNIINRIVLQKIAIQKYN